METLYRVPFLVLECPNLKLKKPPWVHMPSAMTVYALVVVSYFLITGGIIYDVIVEPPSVGSMTDEHGHQRPVAFLKALIGYVTGPANSPFSKCMFTKKSSASMFVPINFPAGRDYPDKMIQVSVHKLYF
uniref:Oligosaccharyltransferase complex subunit n=1 Tax=Canis lupus dingo TaxID=286419 RepID=A0A8C0QSW2_CANLU